jgi:choline dehydrogenase-like flavoprotein
VLLEAGGRDSNLLYRIPAGIFPLMKAGIGNWNFETMAQPGLNDRTYFPRGKVLGGSSSMRDHVSIAVKHYCLQPQSDCWRASARALRSIARGLTKNARYTNRYPI